MQLARDHDLLSEFVVADARKLPFREDIFNYSLSLGSTLSEKTRMWTDQKVRRHIVREALRVLRPGGLIIANFVYRYWSLMSIFRFVGNYLRWVLEVMGGRRTEWGDYYETIGKSKVRFHAFTVGEAGKLFESLSVEIHLPTTGKGLFRDRFFVIAKKS